MEYLQHVSTLGWLHVHPRLLNGEGNSSLLHPPPSIILTGHRHHHIRLFRNHHNRTISEQTTSWLMHRSGRLRKKLPSFTTQRFRARASFPASSRPSLRRTYPAESSPPWRGCRASAAIIQMGKARIVREVSVSFSANELLNRQ